jgi:hypothetical protein
MEPTGFFLDLTFFMFIDKFIDIDHLYILLIFQIEFKLHDFRLNSLSIHLMLAVEIFASEERLNKIQRLFLNLVDFIYIVVTSFEFDRFSNTGGIFLLAMALMFKVVLSQDKINHTRLVNVIQDSSEFFILFGVVMNDLMRIFREFYQISHVIFEI